MEVSPKGPLSHCQCQVCKHLRAHAIKLPNGAGGWDRLVEGNVSHGGRCLHLCGGVSVGMGESQWAHTPVAVQERMQGCEPWKSVWHGSPQGTEPWDRRLSHSAEVHPLLMLSSKDSGVQAAPTRGLVIAYC